MANFQPNAPLPEQAMMAHQNPNSNFAVPQAQQPMMAPQPQQQFAPQPAQQNMNWQQQPAMQVQMQPGAMMVMGGPLMIPQNVVPHRDEDQKRVLFSTIMLGAGWFACCCGGYIPVVGLFVSMLS